jgi:hypothetical protein
MAPALLVLVAGLVLMSCGGGEEEQEPTPEGAEQELEPGGAGRDGRGERSARGAGEDATESVEDPRDDGELIVAAITALLSDPDSRAVCSGLVTPRLLRQSYGTLRGCLDGRPAEALADEVSVDGVEVDADEASATAEAAGGVYDGNEVDVELVRAGGRWLVDSLRADVPVGP